MKIFVLQGRHDSGKTSTLLELIDQLKTSYPGVHVTETPEPHGDKTFVIDNANGKKTGVETAGDIDSWLTKSLHFFVQQNCDVVICPCRTKGKTAQSIEAFVNANTSIDYTQKTLAQNQSTQATANAGDVNTLRAKAGI